jgi:hypothetical protein
MSRCTAQSRTHLRDLRYKIRHLCCCKNLLSAIAAALIVAGSRMCLLLPPPPAAQCVQRWARLGFGPLASALGHVAQSEGERDTHNRNRREHPEPTRENVGSKFQMCRIQPGIFALRSGLTDYAIFLITLYDIIFQWWHLTQHIGQGLDHSIVQNPFWYFIPVFFGRG